jgi:hypothetical protein
LRCGLIDGSGLERPKAQSLAKATGFVISSDQLGLDCRRAYVGPLIVFDIVTQNPAIERARL